MYMEALLSSWQGLSVPPAYVCLLLFMTCLFGVGGAGRSGKGVVMFPPTNMRVSICDILLCVCVYENLLYASPLSMN